MESILFHLVRKVLGNANAVFFNSFWIHILATTFLLLNFTYLNVHLRFAQSAVFVNTAIGNGYQYFNQIEIYIKYTLDQIY